VNLKAIFKKKNKGLLKNELKIMLLLILHWKIIYPPLSASRRLFYSEAYLLAGIFS
jgi:hypothetical protein